MVLTTDGPAALMRLALISLLALLLLAGGVRLAFAQDTAEEEQPGLVYEVTIEGLDGAGELKSLVEESSVLRSRIDDLPISRAALERRAREDEEIFNSVARSLGYYDAVFVPRVDDPVEPGGPVRVLVYGDPGDVYTFDAVTVRAVGEAEAGAGESFRPTSTCRARIWAWSRASRPGRPRW